MNLTDVTPTKFVPVIVTNVPGPPIFGLKLVIPGRILKLAKLVAIWEGTVTVIFPDVAPAGTMAEIELEEIETEGFKERFGGKSIQHNVAPATAAGAETMKKVAAAE